MASTQLAIANLALAKIGSSAITSLTQTGSNEATAINAVYDDVLKELLSEHPWSFAQNRVALSYTCADDTSRTIDDSTYTPVTITGATAANPVVITAASHGLSDGDWVYITNVLGMTELNSNFYIVDDATTNTFSLNDTDGDDVDGSAYTAYTSGGQIQKAIDMPSLGTGAVYVYDKPSDLIKPTGKDTEDAVVSVELNKIISDTASLKIKYTYFNETPSQYFPKFTQALITRLASEICFTITNSTKKTQELITLYNDVDLPRAISVDSTQGTPREAMQDEWLDARLINSGGYATTGKTWHAI